MYRFGPCQWASEWCGLTSGAVSAPAWDVALVAHVVRAGGRGQSGGDDRAPVDGGGAGESHQGDVVGEGQATIVSVERMLQEDQGSMNRHSIMMNPSNAKPTFVQRTTMQVCL